MIYGVEEVLLNKVKLIKNSGPSRFRQNARWIRCQLLHIHEIQINLPRFVSVCDILLWISVLFF